MKLRIQGDSLRLRVSPSELARLLDTGRIEETVHFAQQEDARLTYALEHAAVDREIGVRYTPREVAVVLSTARARQWAEGDEVGIAGDLALGNRRLALLVEKDFACLDRKDLASEDTFPNPRKGAAC
jgi:hypothetical protein